MEEYQGSIKNDVNETSRLQATLWSGLVALFILAAAWVGLGVYSYQQKTMIGRLAVHEADLNATITQLQGQLQDATAKMNDLAEVQAAQAAAAAQAAQSGARGAAVSSAEAARLRRLQAAVTDQQKKLQATQDDVAKTRTDLEGNLNSTRDELNGSIAKTHEELVALEMRGERNYFEFDATKSKEFQHTGPLRISLRKTDPKHANVDLAILVNDREINKKKVNLYEPVWIYEDKDAQPVQVVVNKIDKNSVHGYLSAPKYSREDLATGATIAPAPTSLITPRAGSTANSNPE